MPDDRRRQLCEVAADTIGLDAPSIEKDLWVCWVLRELFALPESGPHLTFKGGTSLSKGWKLIERFSEDIDLVIDRDFLGFSGDAAPDQKGISNNEQRRRLEALRDACHTHIKDVLQPALRNRLRATIPASMVWELTEENTADGGVSLIFKYPSVFPPGSYLRPVVIIELGARSDTEPSENPVIQPYLAEALPDELDDCTFTVRTVAPERTFWEKAMLLHEETYRTEGPKARLARHYYDLWCLIRAGVAERAIANLGLFERVAAHRAIFFRKKREAQESLRRGAMRIVPLPDQTALWKKDYEQMREAMFFGDPPSFDEILDVVREFEKEFNGPGPADNSVVE